MVFKEFKDKFWFLRTSKFFKEFKDEWEACKRERPTSTEVTKRTPPTSFVTQSISAKIHSNQLLYTSGNGA